MQTSSYDPEKSAARPADELAQEIAERAALDQLHREERHAGLLADGEDRDDAGMVEPSHGLDLAAEAGACAVEAELVGPHELDCNAPAERSLLGGVDDAHPATAEAFGEQEIAELPRDRIRDAGITAAAEAHRAQLLQLGAQLVGVLRHAREERGDGRLAALVELLEALEKAAFARITRRSARQG